MPHIDICKFLLKSVLHRSFSNSCPVQWAPISPREDTRRRLPRQTLTVSRDRRKSCPAAPPTVTFRAVNTLKVRVPATLRVDPPDRGSAFERPYVHRFLFIVLRYFFLSMSKLSVKYIVRLITVKRDTVSVKRDIVSVAHRMIFKAPAQGPLSGRTPFVEASVWALAMLWLFWVLWSLASAATGCEQIKLRHAHECVCYQ